MHDAMRRAGSVPDPAAIETPLDTYLIKKDFKIVLVRTEKSPQGISRILQSHRRVFYPMG
jgi:hypothetical protein